MSARAVFVSQSLLGLAPAGIVLLHVTVVVCPTVVGTVTVWAAGVAARAWVVGRPTTASVRTAAVTTERRIGRSSTDGCSPRVQRTVDHPVPARKSKRRLVSLPGWLVTRQARRSGARGSAGGGER